MDRAHRDTQAHRSGGSRIAGGPASCPVLRFMPGAAAGRARIDPPGNLPGSFIVGTTGWIADKTGGFPLAPMPIAAVAPVGTIRVAAIRRSQPRTVAMRH